MIMTEFTTEAMASRDITIDRIHHLVEQARELEKQGLIQEARILIEEAQDHAGVLRAGFIRQAV